MSHESRALFDQIKAAHYSDVGLGKEDGESLAIETGSAATERRAAVRKLIAGRPFEAKPGNFSLAASDRDSLYSLIQKGQPVILAETDLPRPLIGLQAEFNFGQNSRPAFEGRLYQADEYNMFFIAELGRARLLGAEALAHKLEMKVTKNRDRRRWAGPNGSFLEIGYNPRASFGEYPECSYTSLKTEPPFKQMKIGKVYDEEYLADMTTKEGFNNMTDDFLYALRTAIEFTYSLQRKPVPELTLDLTSKIPSS